MKKKRQPIWRKSLRLFLLSISLFLILIGTGVGLYFAIELRKAAEKIPHLPDIIAKMASQPTSIVSADGKVLYSMSVEYRKPIRIRDVPKVVRDATLAAEDRRFYQHDGIDYFSIARGLFMNVKGGRIAQGASTLTMQIAKRLYTHSGKTFSRKFKDMALAIMMERELQKDQILELYLNQVYYGAGAYGIAAAADIYFGKTLQELTLGEVALLARLVRRPSDENPYANLTRAVNNRNYVLKVMLEENMINEPQYNKAIKEKPKLRPRQKHFAVMGRKYAPYFVDYVLRKVKEELPGIEISSGGYRIETTLNYKMQEITENAVENAVRNFSKQEVRTAAFVMTDRCGRILSMVGGANYLKNQYNVIAQGKRLPGSAFKPFVYSVALLTGAIKLTDKISNERYYWLDPSTGKVWAPRNDSKKYGGYVPVREALARSINMPAIRVAERVGGRNLTTLARTLFGFASPLDPGLAIALGCSAVSPLEMVQAYSVFMLNGDRVTPYAIQRIIGPDGSIIRNFKPAIMREVLSGENAKTMDSLLRAVVTEGTGRRAQGVINARGKTGTTTNHLDAWFCGYTDELLGVGWIANEVSNRNYKPMTRVYGGTYTVLIWADIISQAQKLIGEKPRIGAIATPPPLPLSEQPILPPQDSAQLPKSIKVEDGEDASKKTEAPQMKVPVKTVETGPEEESEEEEPDDSASSVEEHDQTDPLASKKKPVMIKPVKMKLVPVPQKSIPIDVAMGICLQSGKRSTSHCPTVRIKTFQKGKEPKERCALHP